MNHLTNKEIFDHFETLGWRPRAGRDYGVDIERVGEEVHIIVNQEYSYVEYDAETLFGLCRLFNTFGVSDRRYESGGCETCDWGSSYEVTFIISPGRPFTEGPY